MIMKYIIKRFLRVLLLFFIVFLISCNRIVPSSNEEIVTYYQRTVQSEFLNQVAIAFVETGYPGLLVYSFQNSGGYHRLRGANRMDLTDTFPKIREIIKEYIPDARDSRYYIWYKNGFVFFYVSPKKFNNLEKPILLFYSEKAIEDIRVLFPGLDLYKESIPVNVDFWLYSFSNNWYICSSDKLLWWDSF